MLAGDGPDRLRDIVRSIAALPDNSEKDRVIAQLMVLSGLRALDRQVEQEWSFMSVIDVTKNSTIMRWRREDEAKGREEGALWAIQKTLRSQMKTKFGRVPVWAQERLASATSEQLEAWCQKILVADTIEGVIGKR